MGGRTLLGMSTENRRLGVAAHGDEHRHPLAAAEPGQEFEVILERETAPREVALPDDLAAAPAAEPGDNRFAGPRVVRA